MDNVVFEYKKCDVCGNDQMTSEYYPKTEQLKDFCDVCGYYHTIELKNKLEDGKYPEGWKPEYETKREQTGFVLKMFPRQEEENSPTNFFIAPINKDDVKPLIEQLNNDADIEKFAISFKDKKGHYQTQIFYKETPSEQKEEKEVKEIKTEDNSNADKTCDVKVDFLNSEIKSSKIDTNLISDGYHTFGELYQHRIELYIALCKELNNNKKSKIWKSKKHSDGSAWDGWFIMGIDKDNGEQITYHLPMDYWRKTSFAEELELAPEFDGHTSDDVLYRISKL
jgi:hypothetical protein